MSRYKRLLGENEHAYVQRVSRHLPLWPEEVIASWLWWGNGLPTLFETLDLARLSFTEEVWVTEKIPGIEVFHSSWAATYEVTKLDLDAGIGRPKQHWLADYMWRNGTWKTGIILLENRDFECKLKTGYGEALKQPFHLLEGHNRLTFLNRLIDLGKANSVHKVWIAKLALNKSGN